MAAYELNKTILKDNTNLKAYYRFESGALTTDSSGNSKTLTNNSATETTGVYGGATSTNGSSQYYSIADALVTGATNWSISAWIKNPSASQLGSPWYCGVTGTNGFGLVFTNGGPGAAGKQISMILHGVGWLFTGVDMPDTTNYHHIVITRDTSTMRIYLNGKHIYSTATAPSAPGSLFSISRDGATGTYYFNGSTDDLAVFSTALSADQIKELYEGRYIGEWRPQSNLVGLWHLNGNSTDSSGNFNNGTDTSITYSLANGKIAQGAGFNGSTSNISLADSSSLDITGNITCMFWVKFAVLPTSGNDAGFFCKWNYGSSGQNSYSYGLYNNSGTYQFLMFRSANGTAGETHQANLPSLTTGVWHHYAMSTTIASHSTDIFYDGNLIGTATNGVITSIFNGNLAAKIGMYTDGVGKVNGAIDEVAIFSRALTAAEIRKYYAWSMGRYL